ncbi:MAG TPA: hypothetical protein VFT22_30345 [Kofleriaceae bacterium]|nr:hypothetical protein [Kofleriaceae bacterium]
MICVLACTSPSLRASADILIESYREERPVDADRVLAPLRDELARVGVKARVADVIAEAGDQLPLPGVAAPALGAAYPAEPSGQVELGVRQVFHADYDVGLATLAAVIDAAQHNPARVVADPTAPGWLTKAYAAIAFAHLRSHHPDLAAQAIVEQIHGFPDHPIGRTVGPEIATLAETMRSKLDASPHGILRITTSRPEIQAFLDEHARGSNSVIPNLPVGRYRVLLMRAGVSRRYSVDIAPDRITDLRVDWEADTAFQVTPEWVGFTWPRGQPDETDAAAARYARATRQHDLFVAHIVQRGPRRFLAGKIFEKQTGVLLRHKAVDLGKDDGSCVRALAQYLWNGEQSACLVDVPGESDAPEKRGRAARDPYLLPGLVAGAGAAAALGGVAVLASTRDPADGGPRYVSGPGIALVAGGALAIGVAGYLAHRASGGSEAETQTLRRSRAPVYASAVAAAAAFIVGGYLLHLDGNGTCGVDGPTGCAYRYRTAPYGGALIGAGVAAAGFGIYWYVSAPADSRGPAVTLTVTGSGGVAGIGGIF